MVDEVTKFPVSRIVRIVGANIPANDSKFAHPTIRTAAIDESIAALLTSLEEHEVDVDDDRLIQMMGPVRLILEHTLYDMYDNSNKD